MNDQGIGEWTTRWARSEDEPALLALFERAFGTAISAPHWRWKYRLADTPGTVCCQGDEVIAFNGGMPRESRVLGEPCRTVQMGDVMVDPAHRGVLTRRGAFARMVTHYFGERVGPAHDFRLAFGFPHARACRVGVRQDLYCEVDRIVEARWPALEGRNWRHRLTPVTHAHQSELDGLWQAMAADTARLAINCRDGQWWCYRYLDKPANDYRSLLALKRAGGTALGAMTLRVLDDERVELLDLAGPQRAMPALVRLARRQTQRLGRRELIAWMTPSALAWCGDTGAERHATEVVVPGSAINAPERALEVRDRWWLMGGDSDFR